MELTRPIDRIRLEHTLICAELDVLKIAERDERTFLWQTLRDVCSRLSDGLEEHMNQGPQPLCDHHGDYRYLQVISRHIASEDRPFLLNNRLKLLAGFIQGLQRHMDTQEAELVERSQPSLALNGARAV